MRSTRVPGCRSPFRRSQCRGEFDSEEASLLTCGARFVGRRLLAWDWRDVRTHEAVKQPNFSRNHGFKNLTRPPAHRHSGDAFYRPAANSADYEECAEDTEMCSAIRCHFNSAIRISLNSHHIGLPACSCNPRLPLLNASFGSLSVKSRINRPFI